MRSSKKKECAPKIKVILWYLGLENLCNFKSLQICTSRTWALFTQKISLFAICDLIKIDFKDIDLRQLSLEKRAQRVLKFIKSVLITRIID